MDLLSAAEEHEVRSAQAAIHTYVTDRLAKDARDKQKNHLRKSLRLELSVLKERRIESDY